MLFHSPLLETPQDAQGDTTWQSCKGQPCLTAWAGRAVWPGHRTWQRQCHQTYNKWQQVFSPTFTQILLLPFWSYCMNVASLIRLSLAFVNSLRRVWIWTHGLTVTRSICVGVTMNRQQPISVIIKMVHYIKLFCKISLLVWQLCQYNHKSKAESNCNV